MADGFNRRRALSLMAAASATGAGAWPGIGYSRSGFAHKVGHRSGMPWLYSPDQLQAELMLLRLVQDPAVKAIQAKLKTELAAGQRAKLPDAAATLDAERMAGPQAWWGRHGRGQSRCNL
jgi:hypothetical protein